MNLQDVDFTILSVGEALDMLKALKKPGLEPLIRWVAQGHAYTLGSQHVRVALADAERNVERLTRESEQR